jgi:hypothetical protein
MNEIETIGITKGRSIWMLPCFICGHNIIMDNDIKSDYIIQDRYICSRCQTMDRDLLNLKIEEKLLVQL